MAYEIARASALGIAVIDQRGENDIGEKAAASGVSEQSNIETVSAA